MGGESPIGTVELFVNDLVEVSKIDGNDHHLLDAVIDKFCEDHFGEGSERETIAGALLKTGLHAAAEDGLSRSEVLAALSVTGNVINSNVAIPTELIERAEEMAGPDAEHLYDGLIGFIDASENGGQGRDAGPSAEPALPVDPNTRALNDLSVEGQITPMQTRVLNF